MLDSSFEKDSGIEEALQVRFRAIASIILMIATTTSIITITTNTNIIPSLGGSSWSSSLKKWSGRLQKNSSCREVHPLPCTSYQYILSVLQL